MSHRAAMAVLLCFALCSSGRPAAGQEWVVDASAGSTDYAGVAGTVGSRNAILGVRYEGAPWLYLSAGAPLDSAGLPWIAGGTGGRLTSRPGTLMAGLDLEAHGFGYRVANLGEDGWGLTLAGIPFLSLSRGTARVELRSGALHHSGALADATESRTVMDSGLRGSLSSFAGILLSAEGRLVSASEGSYAFAGAGVEAPVGPGTLWLRAGHWMTDALPGTSWNIGARVELPPQLTLRVAFQRDADDPLYWNGPRRGWSVGLSRAFGPRSHSHLSAPVPVAIRNGGGQVAVRLPIAEVRQAPSVAGDFNDWKPATMQRAGEFWEIHLSLKPGVYHYSFVRADGSWFVPESFPNRTDDGFGGVNAVLVVTGS
jgi:hypothetical protein